MAERSKQRQPSKLRQVIIRTATATMLMGLVVAVFAFVFASLVKAQASTWVVVVVFAIIIVALGIMVGSYISNKFAQPLEDLSARANRFADGDYSVDFTITEGTEEVIEMSKSLAAITRSTKTALRELREEEERQTQFVSDVSHEIRTPLTGIRGYAETLQEGDVPDEIAQRFLGSIISECDRLTRLANDLLTLQRIDATSDKLALKRIDLREVVESVADTLEPLLEDRNIELSISGEAPDVLGDRDRLVQVMVNLIENASRFAERHVHIELVGINANSVITVSDDGPGFGDIDPSRLFDRFYRADMSRQSATGGSGLGLAIVKSIVTAHDGTVEAFNLVNGGACFAVALPSIAPQ